MDFLLHFGPSHYMDLFRCEHPYFSREGRGDASLFVETYKKNYRLTEGKGMICIPSGNHDMERMRKFLDPEEMKMAFAFLLSMPGAPFLYYGDEIGLRHLKLTSVGGGGITAPEPGLPCSGTAKRIMDFLRGRGKCSIRPRMNQRTLRWYRRRC